MIENEVHTLNPRAGSPAQQNIGDGEPGSTLQLMKSILESTGLQAKFNEAILARINDLANEVIQTREMLRQTSTVLGRRIDQLLAASPAWGRVVAPAGHGLLLTKVLNTFLMYMEAADMSVAPHLVANGIWEKTITEAFAARLKPGMTVVDVGANYGYYSLLSACCVGGSGRVYSFEPNPRTFEVLKKNIEVNCLGSVVQAHQLAVLDSRRQIELHVLRQFQGSSSQFAPELVPEPDTPPEERVRVDGVPLDEIIGGPVDLIKIDAEGSEPLVLEGMQSVLNRSPRLTIIMEINLPMIRKCSDPEAFLEKVRRIGGTMQYFTPWNTLEPFDQPKAMEFPLFNLLIERK